MAAGPGATEIAQAGCRLAEALRSDWEAIHIETPADIGRDQRSAADALGLAASLGATVSNLPAATVAAGLAAHLENASARHLMIGRPLRSRRLFPRRTLLDEIIQARPDIMVHVAPIRDKMRADTVTPSDRGAITAFAYALAAVALTVALALVLNRVAGIQYLSFLFFFPVIASAARLGTRPALAAAVTCAVAFNFFFLVPLYTIKPAAFQSWIMSAALIAVALYTGALTANFRARAILGERSAQENANIATFVSDLTRAADWNSTAQVICSGIGSLLNVQTVLAKEVSGVLTVIASTPPSSKLDPLDGTALEWAWRQETPAGAGSEVLSAANWYFTPLSTSLGTLAVLGLSTPDGRDPISAVSKLLLSTLIAQSALALERLRLEDEIRTVAARDANSIAHPSRSSTNE